MIRRKALLRWVTLFFAISFFLVDSSQVSAKSASLVFRPLPIRVEGQIMPSGLWLGVIEKEFGIPLTQIAAASPENSAERKLESLLQSVVQDDISAFALLVDLGGNQEAVAKQFRAFRATIPSIDKVKVIRCLYVGTSRFFVLDITEATRPLITLLFSAENGRYRCNLKDMGQPVSQNLSALSRAVQSLPDSFVPHAEPPKGALMIELSGTFGTDPEYPIVLAVQGCPVEVVLSDLPETQIGLEDRDCMQENAHLLKFYAETFALLRNGELDAYLARFGPASRKKLQAFLADEGSRKMYVESQTRLRQVSAILGTGQIRFIVFQSFRGPYQSESVKYDVMRIERDGSIQRVNVGQEGPLDALLRYKPVTEAILRNIVNSRKPSK